jgi:hypothetical protein
LEAEERGWFFSGEARRSDLTKRLLSDDDISIRQALGTDHVIVHGRDGEEWKKK